MDEVKYNNRIYNSIFEISTRVLVLLNALKETKVSIHKIMILDHLTLNTHDIGGPASLHAPIPNRGVQVYARKELIEKSIKFLIAKRLIEIVPDDSGLTYQINENGIMVLDYFESRYFNKLSEKSRWVATNFGDKNQSDLKEFVSKNLKDWGEEFMSDDNYAQQV